MIPTRREYLPEIRDELASTRMEAIGFGSDLAAAQDLFPILEQEVERLKTLLPALTIQLR